MQDLFRRYIAGEREEVWADLRNLGAEVRSPALIGEAMAVAQETVRRAKLNLQSIILRLNELGFAFAKSGGLLVEPAKDVKKRLARLERDLGGPMPLILSAWYEQIGAVSILGSHPVFCPPPVSAAGIGRLTGAQLESMRNQVTPDPFVMFSFDAGALARFRRASDPARRLTEAQARLREFDANMAQTRATTAEKFPDVFSQIELRLAPEREKLQQAVRHAATPAAFHLEVGPDDVTKFGESGDSYYVALPDGGADFLLLTTGPEETFVSYLRRSFRCGGFAGWDGFANIPPELLHLGSSLLPL